MSARRLFERANIQSVAALRPAMKTGKNSSGARSKLTGISLAR